MISICKELKNKSRLIPKYQILIVVCLISATLIPGSTSYSAPKICSLKADTSSTKITNEKLLGNFSGGVFGFTHLKDAYYLVSAGQSEGGGLFLLDSATGENNKISIELPIFRSVFKIIKSPSSSVGNPEIFFSALAWGDSNTPRYGRQSQEPKMQKILPSGLVVYKAEVNLEKKKLENLKLVYNQKVFLVTTSNYGGALALSNDQRFLYISVGDQGNYDTVQQTSSGVGKILRFNLDGSIPKDNPFLVSEKSTELYAYGFRNVYGIVQMPTGELLAIDHGPLGGDELNLVRKTGNYGWPISSEGVHLTGEFISSFVSKTIGPVLSWSDAVAPSAISVISKNKFSELNGDVLVSTLKGKSIFRIHNYCGSKFKIVEKLSFDFRIRDFSVTQNGQLIILSDANPAKLSVFTMDR